MTTLTLLHPGEMGAAIGAQAVTAGHTVRWVTAGRSAATLRRAEAAGLTPCASLSEALDGSDLAVSVCPPQAAEGVAAEVAALGFAGIYLDANAISPHRAERIAEGAAGCALDGAIIGPPPRDGKQARLYLSGDRYVAEQVEAVFMNTTVHTRYAGDGVGAASALKMSFASFQKTARTLAAVAHALADAHGVADLLKDEARRMPSAILADSGYLPSVAGRAWRWKPEMYEITDTMVAAGLPGDLATATAAVLNRWAHDKDRYDLPLAEVLAHLRQEPAPAPAD
ncbi:NAD(P)-dependent oxidoreductase [Streptomyces mobaraensis]|uniref:NAD(P)-dependent oxidoreductase n=1 Tax=Streptomyces mobaraensis TaxID=35621 RepID=A0A5N5W319_STRMB|nr:NAD(P)-dependent oxidoreductase [Streptomyces mobaraensis]KAB7835756.1 NAD(P)-dependent oxidoreductase [Streptomyces mobaraensis]